MIRLCLVAWSGLSAARLHRQRSIITVFCLVVMLTPYAAGLGLSCGIQQEAEASIEFGADLYITGSKFGRTAPIPLEYQKFIGSIDGVVKLTPRIVGQMELGRDRVAAVVVGIDAAEFPLPLSFMDGRLPKNGSMNELVIGQGLAQRLGWKVGSVLPPFYRNSRGERLTKVVGVFKATAALWEINTVFTTFATAAHIFDDDQRATDILVQCRQGYTSAVVSAVLQQHATGNHKIGIHITSREMLTAKVSKTLFHHQGIFSLFFVFLFVAGILVLIVTSGIGSSERRREVGVLKATGWQTDEVLLRAFTESCLLAVVGASCSILIAFAWMRWFAGLWLADVFLPDWTSAGNVAPPFALTVMAFLLVQLIAFAIVTSGTVYSCWRTAITLPITSLRRS